MGRKKSRFYKDQPRQKAIPVDTNSLIIESSSSSTTTTTTTAAAKEERELFTETTTVPPNPTALGGGRKQKQLEKYIAKKLKKDSRPLLVARLQAIAFNNGQLRSTKDLLVSTRRDSLKKIKSIPEKVMIDPTLTLDEEEKSDNDRSSQQKVAPFIPDYHASFDTAAIFSIKESLMDPLKDETDSDSDAVTDKRDHYSEVEDDLNLPINSSLLPPWETHYIIVERRKEIEEQRVKLPVYAEEQTIMETLQCNPVTIICGQTGSGKTTQVPQFLYESGFGDPMGPNPGLIGITQPRRVAATSMAQRVGVELDKPEHVSYQVRYDGTVSKNTRIKFMTDGILLRELTEDFMLSKYSVILLDEAHERNLNTDILIGMLSRVVRMRNQLACKEPQSTRPLRLIVMSATLDVKEFITPRLFFPPPPVLRVQARQHPVTMHFSRTTDHDYISSAFKMICKIHSNLPPGGILVFLTGKQEIVKLSHRLNQKYRKENFTGFKWREEEDEEELVESSMGEASDSDNETRSTGEEISDEEFSMKASTREPLHVLPLYSLLAPEEQLKVFQAPPEGHRLCVLATNVAETSLTIPNIRYVVDCGLVKERHFDPVTGSQEFRIEWTSKASATQRAGRAGRLGPGHCYRLYSSTVFDQQFPAFSEPEIRRTPIEGLVLQLKAMGIDHAERFPLPSLPEKDCILSAQRNLLGMGALCKASPNTDSHQVKITPLGRKMAKLPLAPIWSRLVIVALEMNESPLLCIALSAVMSVGDPFNLDTSPTLAIGEEEEGGVETERKRHSLRQAQMELAGKPPKSDLLMWLNAFVLYLQEAPTNRHKFCLSYHLMAKRLKEMLMQFQLLERIIKPIYPHYYNDDGIEAGLKYRQRNHNEHIRKLILQSLSDRVAERIKNPQTASTTTIPGFKSLPFPAYRLLDRSLEDSEGIAYLHPSSALISLPPQFLVYAELVQTENGKYLKYVTAIEIGWLPQKP